MKQISADQAYAEGYRAFTQGVLYDNNPFYKHERAHYYRWRAGWADALEDTRADIDEIIAQNRII